MRTCERKFSSPRQVKFRYNFANLTKDKTMSVEFRVKNKKRPLFMGYSDTMSVSKALDLLPDLSVFGIDESAEDFDERAFLKSPLSEHECLILGVRGKSGRGMELSYDEDQQSYAVRVNTPATIFDWVLAISYLQALSKQLGGRDHG